jgi:hypothetical protein
VTRQNIKYCAVQASQTSIVGGTQSYRSLAVIALRANETFTVFSSYGYLHSQREAALDNSFIKQLLSQPTFAEKEITASQKRWDKYLSQGIAKQGRRINP